MMQLRRLKGTVKRWWRGRGFGVHSPFAFYFITRVLRERLPYYAYADKLLGSGGRNERKELRTLFRVICYFAPRKVWLAGCAPRVAEVVRLADSRICVDCGEAPFAVVGPGFAGELPAGYDVAVFMSGAGEQAMREWRRVEHGMHFTNGRMTVIVRRRDFTPQSYEVNF